MLSDAGCTRQRGRDRAVLHRELWCEGKSLFKGCHGSITHHISASHTPRGTEKMAYLLDA